MKTDIQNNITPEFLKAFLNFQKNCPAIEKDNQSVNKDGQVKYKYAGLPQIMLRVTPILNENELMLNQLITSDLDVMTFTTILAHVSGGMLVSTIQVKKNELIAQYMNGLQGIGNSISYYRRYQATSILNLVTEEDQDGNSPKFLTDAEIIERDKQKERAEKEKAEADAKALEDHIQKGKEKNGPLNDQQIEEACHKILEGDETMFDKCQKYLITPDQISLLKVAQEQSNDFLKV